MKKHILTVIMLAVILFSSCDTFDDLDKMPDPEVEYSSTYPISGEYYAEFSYTEHGDLFGAGLVPLYIYNTAADDGQDVWITDYIGSDPSEGSYWGFRVKCPVNMDDLSFGSADTLIDEGFGIKVVVRNGQILEEATEQPSGTISDSIFCEIWFEDIGPYINSQVGDIIAEDEYLNVSGFRRSGFLEDEH